MSNPVRVPAAILAGRIANALDAAGASPESVAATTRALMHASLIGVDSHGARLTESYVEALREGRANRRPSLSVRRTGAGTALVDGDDALGHLTGYRAMDLAIEIARDGGVGAVGAIRSTHYGAAGAYAVAAAEAGLIGFATTNSESLVAPFDGSEAFHGTNPLAFACPVKHGKPWLVDMATSSVPINRVLLFQSLGRPLPPNVAADARGVMTEDSQATAMLMPLGGGDFGFKGAALAGVATMLSAILTGAALDHEMAQTERAADGKRPPDMGHFFLAIDPARFVGRELFDQAVQRYLAALRSVPPRPDGEAVLAPGDREWLVEADRRRTGVPVDPDTARFLRLTGPDGSVDEPIYSIGPNLWLGPML